MKISRTIFQILIALFFACEVAANQDNVFACKVLTVNPLTKKTECAQCQDGYVLKNQECVENFDEVCIQASGLTCNIRNCLMQIQGYYNQVYRFTCRTCAWPYNIQNGVCAYYCSNLQEYVEYYSDCPIIKSIEK